MRPCYQRRAAGTLRAWAPSSRHWTRPPRATGACCASASIRGVRRCRSTISRRSIGPSSPRRTIWSARTSRTSPSTRRRGSPASRALGETIEAVPAGVPVILDAKAGRHGQHGDRLCEGGVRGVGSGCGHGEPVPRLRCGPTVPGVRRSGGLRPGAHVESRRGGVPVARDRRTGRRAHRRRVRGAGVSVRARCPAGAALECGGGTWGWSWGRPHRASSRGCVGSARTCRSSCRASGRRGATSRRRLRNGADANGRRVVINASRSVLYAARGAGYGEAARAEALRLREAINAELGRMGRGWT